MMQSENKFKHPDCPLSSQGEPEPTPGPEVVGKAERPVGAAAVSPGLS